jgi:opacity protein-like surface antigen
MKPFLATAALAAALLAPAAYADCTYPQAPTNLPDGSTATLKEMIAGMQQVSTYNKAMEGYLACIKLERDSRVAQAGATLTKKQKEELEAIEIQKNNAAVDQLHAVANQFNAQVKIFKSKDKKSDSN